MTTPPAGRTSPAAALTPTDVAAIHRRTLTTVVASQMLGGAGLAAGVTVGALLAQDMLGTESVAGLPSGLFTLGSAVAAFTVGRYSQVAGRRRGLAAGFAVGALGATAIVVAAVLNNPVLFFFSLFIYGAGTATNLQARYAGADLAPASQRATAASLAMVATTFGAVAGPNLVQPLGDLAEQFGIPRLAGPFLLAAVAYGLAGVVLFIFLRPDPLLTAQACAAEEEVVATRSDAATSVAATRSGVRSGAPRVASGVLLGATVMVLTQVTMVAIMTMTPVHMRHHHHDLSQIGLVIGFHIAAMFLPSPVTGRLVDRIGRLPMAVAAALTLLAAGVLGALAPGDSMVLISLALILLGLGWNFGLISGTALIVDSTPVSTRARTQGSVDVLIALAGAGGGVMSGVIVGASSFSVLALGGGILSLALIPVAVWYAAQPAHPTH
ncbi:MFS transporter [Kribbia dieselivorans]|uniref:MFS transporter n=1 Tax=Kribbia dieselivorans TaxID=331526 RepID=UPI000839A775|nr:MFS transporter [Kribbia dieselivorans]